MTWQDLTDNSVAYSASGFGTTEQRRVRPQSCSRLWNKKREVRNPGLFWVELGRWRARVWSGARELVLQEVHP